tara:strand:+ start:73 stop:423 length:351 start_codon:yes stop_codon:yes gene_type:complete
MDIYIDTKLVNVLSNDIKKFKSALLNENYEAFIEISDERINNLFFYSIVKNNKIMKKLKLKLLNHNIEEKDINDLFYKILKFHHKHEEGIFSWNEIEEWDIDFEDIKKTTTKYTLI